MKKHSFLNTLQYILSAFIAFMFAAGLIPGFYDKVAPYIFFAILLQLIISVLRARLLNIILELSILILSILSLIPLLGYIFRVIGILFSILEMVSFKHTSLYQKVQINTFSSKKPVKKSKKPQEFKDVEFNEK